jgi:hypothetical protein
MGMALEYDWSGNADVGTVALRSFIATATAGSQSPDGTIFLNGMYVTARAVSGDDINPAIELFGFQERFSATFRFANTADPATADHNTALMVHVLITFAQRHGGSGILLHNGEEAVLQYDETGIVFAEGWDDWTENGEVAALLDQFASRVLPQPLL